ncbi:hypothetical protein JCM15457_962 [Liquorilactobacillus sucicola DSM 21376 = JCM 15457]|uniref:Uncharacterized protein n=1 Tax=Liquorilactobacillus sucicola DSM 21376 = JCM 15457 TaxID=1423806 RepID=A0A023CWT9_9LACO|nr:hypothetical protein FD15_GL001319 [Liquorilactobacillus sucicola DSM 21376 = JCM 15457]GAJ26051.1 hypothetical protein JCM15457_962 [Liquorilactobacillus sucicola DSM 21376 = JCM 15457]
MDFIFKEPSIVYVKETVPKYQLGYSFFLVYQNKLKLIENFCTKTLKNLKNVF